MGLFELLLYLALIGFALWLIVTLIPMEPVFKQAIVGIVVLVVVFWVVRMLLGAGPNIRIGG